MFFLQTPRMFSPHQLPPPLTQLSQSSQWSQSLFSSSSSQPRKSPVPPLRQPSQSPSFSQWSYSPVPYISPPSPRQPSQSPVPELISISAYDWNSAIQEEENKSNEKTLCKKYPQIWNVLINVMAHWVHCKFEVALQKCGTHSTRFKNTFTLWVLQNHVLLPIS